MADEQRHIAPPAGKAPEYISARKQGSRAHRLLAVLSCVAVLAISFALMLPALSMTRGALECDLEEHQHTEACYEKVLVCDKEEGEDHQHTDACYEEKLTCKKVEHKHTDACYEQVKSESKGDDGAGQGGGSSGDAASANDVANADGANGAGADGAVDGASKNADGANGGSADGESTEGKASSQGSSSESSASSSASSVGAVEAGSDSDKPAQSFEADLKDEDGEVELTVSVEAPKGAFPAGTFMEIDRVAPKDVKDAVEDAVRKAEGDNVKVKSMTAVDIKFRNSDGDEIEPAKKVQVKITSPDVRDFEDPVLVHVIDKGKKSAKGKDGDAELVDDVKVISRDEEEPAEGSKDTVKFKADAFSPYVIVELEELTGQVITANGEAYDVKVTYGPDAGIPEGAELEVNEIVAESDGYDEYVSKAESALGVDDLGYIRLFDIKIVDKDDHSVKYQPAEGTTVDVNIELADTEGDDLGVVHFADKDDAGSVVDGVKTNAGAVKFAADGFSVYAVVAGSTGDNARATVNFLDKNGDNITTVYVKNSDTLDELAEILCDPGAGTLEEGDLFRGWSIDTEDSSTDGPDYTTETESMTIEDVRAYLEALAITEGDEVNVYAMIFKAYSVQFKDEDGVTIHSETLINKSGEAASYTVNMPYTPKSQDAAFLGWNVTTGSDKIDPAPGEMEDGLYPNGTEVAISGNVIFSPKAPNGHWLIFKENGNGASYTPPQFIKDGDKPTAPAENPTRLGYTFGGWYTDANCTAGNEFNFNQELTQRTTVYAKWTEVATANYTVIIWQESMSDTYAGNVESGSRNYDFYESYTLTGNVGSTINAVSNSNRQVTDADGSYYNVRVRGTDTDGNAVNDIISITGYHAADYDTNVTITPEGTAVVNVYYDRNAVTYTFYTYEDGYEETTGTGGDQYGYYNGEYVPIYYNDGTWYRTRTWVGGFIFGRWVYSNPYDGTRYRNVSDWQQYQYEKGLYGETLNWPTDSSIWWYEDHNNNSGTGTRMTYKSAFLPLDDDMTVEYWGNKNQQGSSYIHFWTQDVSGGESYTDQYQVATGGGNFSINDKFTGFYAYQYRADNGTWHNVGTLNPSTGIYGSSVSYNSRLDIRYNRIKGTITFMDGSYFNGNGVNMEETPKADAFATSDEYYYQADISSYNESGSNYYTPNAYHDGYSFAGWYADDTCTQPYNFTTMPATGVTVYAKWIKTQYRVFLHPNVDSSDTSLDWGDQSMCFRVDYGDNIAGGSTIYGTRDDYELIGWYTDEECTQSFNFEAYVLNDTTVTTPYDQTEPTELDEYGNPTSNENRDAVNNRTWITKKLDLYAKWRAKLDGAKGINIVYDPNDTKNNIEGKSGSEPTDTLDYLDNSEAVAGAASRPVDASTYQFLYWVVQTWDETQGKYVDSDNKVYPGDTFTVLKDNAKVEDITPTGDDPSTKKYTVQLRAEYGPRTEPTPTHITWYDNFTENPVKGVNYFTDEGKQINEAVAIKAANTFTRAGYTFLGWARVDASDDDYTLSPQNLTADDLFLKYENGEFKAKNDDGNWVAVTQVAADERNPYHDLYAVWEASSVPLKIVKVDQEDKPLENATFSFVGENIEEPSLVSTIATGSTEALIYKNDQLPYGEYTLTETNPPDGYNALPYPIVITAGVEENAVVVKATMGGEAIDSKHLTLDAETGQWTLMVQDEAGVELPTTGGPGTGLFTLAGLLLIMGAGAALVVRRKVWR